LSQDLSGFKNYKYCPQLIREIMLKDRRFERQRPRPGQTHTCNLLRGKNIVLVMRLKTINVFCIYIT